jgi:opacity protein-like surface antigen
MVSFSLPAKRWVKIGPFVGAYFPHDAKLKDFYTSTDVIYGLRLGVHIWNGLFIWLTGSQFKAISETTILKDVTRLTLNPLHLSLRYTLPYGSLNPYAQIGYTQIYFKEESVLGIKKDKSTGFSLGSGVEFNLSSHIILDLGLNYSQAKIKIQVSDSVEEEFDLGGFEVALSFLVFI